MSAIQYQKVLSIAEALLRKVEMPKKTIKKYEALKSQILSSPQHPNPQELPEIQNEAISLQFQITEEISHIYQFFISSITEIFTSLLKNDKSNKEKSQNLITPFFEYFDEKKREIRDIVIESSTNLQNRLSLKKYLNEVDEMETSFESFVNILGSFQDFYLFRLENEESYLKKIDKVEDELDEALETIKAQSATVKEVELLQIEKEANLEKIKILESRVIEVKEEAKRAKDELEGRIGVLDEEKKLILRRISDFEEIEAKFVDFFTPYFKNNNHNFNGIPPEFEKLIFAIFDLFEKFENESKFFKEKSIEYGNELERLTKEKEEVERTSVNKRRCLDDLIRELGDVVVGNERTHCEIRMLQDEYRMIVGDGNGCGKVLY